jgi:hypothetical protein
MMDEDELTMKQNRVLFWRIHHRLPSQEELMNESMEEVGLE